MIRAITPLPLALLKHWIEDALSINTNAAGTTESAL